MGPHIQYAKTSDGVSIAYYAMGEGPALVLNSTVLWSHLQAQHPHYPPEFWRDGRGLGRTQRLVRFDARGTGLSDQRAVDFSMEARMRDLEGVVDHLSLGEFALFAQAHGAPAAIAYAAAHPERLTHLVLRNGYARGEDFRSFADRWDSYREIMDKDWKGYTLALANFNAGYRDATQARTMAEMYRRSMTPDSVRAYFAELREIDTTAMLGLIRTPTLVMAYGSAERSRRADFARQLATSIEGARLVERAADAYWIWGDDDTRVIEEFFGLSAAADAAPAGGKSSPGPLRTIVFTDLASSTALTQRLGDAEAQELVRAHNSIVREALAAHGGTEIKHTGDGIMASFPTASGALECAASIQRAVVLRNEADLQVYIGLNAGEPVAEESDLFGTSVQLARRICDHAEAGQILVSNVVRELAAGKGFQFSDLGEVVPKGFEEPVRLYEVRWRE